MDYAVHDSLEIMTDVMQKPVNHRDKLGGVASFQTVFRD